MIFQRCQKELLWSKGLNAWISYLFQSSSKFAERIVQALADIKDIFEL